MKMKVIGRSGSIGRSIIKTWGRRERAAMIKKGTGNSLME